MLTVIELDGRKYEIDRKGLGRVLNAFRTDLKVQLIPESEYDVLDQCRKAKLAKLETAKRSYAMWVNRPMEGRSK